MKPLIVVFTKNNARILKSYNLPAVIHRKDLVFVNPDLSRVQGVAPHFWKVEQGLIVEMTRPEKEARLKHIERHRADNDHKTPIFGPKETQDHGLYYLLAALLAVLAAAAMHGLVK